MFPEQIRPHPNGAGTVIADTVPPMRKAPVIALTGLLGVVLVWSVVSRNNGEAFKKSGLNAHTPSEIGVAGLQKPDNEELNIRTVLDSFELGDSGTSRTRICRLGLELANQIRTERIDKSGGSRWPADAAVPLEKPKPICSI